MEKLLSLGCPDHKPLPQLVKAPLKLLKARSQIPRFLRGCAICSSFVHIEARRRTPRRVVQEIAMPRLASIVQALAIALAAGIAMPPAAAQDSIRNPLRPKTEEGRKAQQADKKPEEKAESAKPSRERSAKQKQNDEMMRACGSEWRAEKAALQAKGETWRSFLSTCRAKKKAETPV
jgi:hypothetical protein